MSANAPFCTMCGVAMTTGALSAANNALVLSVPVYCTAPGGQDLTVGHRWFTGSLLVSLWNRPQSTVCLNDQGALCVQ